MEISVKEDLRGRLGVVRDQGPYPTCLAFAASDAHAALRPPWKPLSALYLFHCASRRDDRPLDDGVTLPTILHALREDGQPCEERCQYPSQADADLSTWRPPTELGQLYKCVGQQTAHSFDGLISHIDAQTTPIILLDLTMSFFKATDSAVIDLDPPGTPTVGARHAVIGVAHGVNGDGRCVLVRNSWGAAWGVNGHAWLTEAYIRKQMFSLALISGVDNVLTDRTAA